MLMRSYFSVNTARVRDEALRLRYVSTEAVLEECLRERESDEMVSRSEAVAPAFERKVSRASECGESTAREFNGVKGEEPRENLYKTRRTL